MTVTTANLALIVTDTLAVAVTPRVSVAVTVAVNGDPTLVAYVWVVEQPLPAGEPSPKFQLQVAAPTPPEVVPVRLTTVPTSVGFGLAAADTASLALTTNDTAGEVPVAAAESVTVTVTLNVPAEAYVCVVETPEPAGEPSPKFQLKLT